MREWHSSAAVVAVVLLALVRELWFKPERVSLTGPSLSIDVCGKLFPGSLLLHRFSIRGEGSGREGESLAFRSSCACLGWEKLGTLNSALHAASCETELTTNVMLIK